MAARKGKKKILETKKYRLLLLCVVRFAHPVPPGFGICWEVYRLEGGREDVVCRLGGVGGGRIVVVVVVEIKKYTQFGMLSFLQGLLLPQLVLPLAVLLLS